MPLMHASVVRASPTKVLCSANAHTRMDCNTQVHIVRSVGLPSLPLHAPSPLLLHAGMGS